MQKLISEAKQARKSKIRHTVVTGGLVTTAVLNRQPEKFVRLVVFPVTSVSALLAIAARERQNNREEALTKLISLDMPLIKIEYADQHKAAENSKWKSIVIPIRGNGLKLSTQEVSPKQLVSRGTRPLLLKTCKRIAFRPKDLFGTDQYAWWVLKQFERQLERDRTRAR